MARRQLASQRSAIFDWHPCVRCECFWLEMGRQGYAGWKIIFAPVIFPKHSRCIWSERQQVLWQETLLAFWSTDVEALRREPGNLPNVYFHKRFDTRRIRIYGAKHLTSKVPLWEYLWWFAKRRMIWEMPMENLLLIHWAGQSYLWNISQIELNF